VITAVQALILAANDFNQEADILQAQEKSIPGAGSWDTPGFIRGLRAVAVALTERADDLNREKPVDTIGTRSWVDYRPS